MSSSPKSVATLLVEIAKDLFDFGCVAEQRGRNARIPGDDPVALFTYASPKNNPALKRPLSDIRDDIAAVFHAQHGSAPNRTALGDAMSVLEGIARQAEPEQAEPGLLELLAGAVDEASRVLQLVQDQYTLGITEGGEVFVVPTTGPNVARLLRGGRRSLKAELAKRYHDEHHHTINGDALSRALLVLQGEAQTLEPSPVALRVARVDGQLVLDLGADDGRVVAVDRFGWRVENRSPITLWRTHATLPLPTPHPDGTLADLHDLLNIDDEDWPLVVAWLVAALFADMPHPVLMLRGEQGVAKSSAARMLASLVDRCASQLRTAPHDVENWAVAVAGSWVTVLDNVTNLQPWLSDAICRAVTGDGMLRRALFTNQDVDVLAFQRVVAITSIDPASLAGDLADRLITVELERIPESRRVADQQLAETWAKVHPYLLGGLLNLAVDVLSVLPSIRETNLPRMADYGRVLLAVDHVLGTTGYARYLAQATSTAVQVVESDPVAIAIRAHIREPWLGSAGELLAKLTGVFERPPKGWPTTPQGMGARLTRVAPALRSVGWTVEQEPRTARTRRWTIAPPGPGR